MIPKASPSIQSLHIAAIETPREWDDDLDAPRRTLWREVFLAAQTVAQDVNRTTNRDLTAQDVVDHWYLDIETQTTTAKDFKAHDRTTGFKTIAQELRDAEDEEDVLRYRLWEREFRKWWMNGKVGKKPILPKRVSYRVVEYGDYEAFGASAWNEVEEEERTLALLKERRDFQQDSMDDPENPYEDSRGNRRLAVRHRERGDFKFYRGNKGVAGGIYTTTRPEPAYRSAQNRASLLKALLRSDNVLDVELAKGMNRKFRFPADKRAAANAARS